MTTQARPHRQGWKDVTVALAAEDDCSGT